MQKFLCDEMVVRLGKWLRAAGYDTLIAEGGSSDRALLELALKENRLLITRDRKFQEMKGSAAVLFLLQGNAMVDWVHSLSQRLQLNWLYRPFSRCLCCNGKLEAGAAELAVGLPAYVKDEGVAVFHCPVCRKAYWQGGHVRRMREKLAQWNKISGAGRSA